jgi:hypothetical protein
MVMPTTTDLGYQMLNKTLIELTHNRSVVSCMLSVVRERIGVDLADILFR